MARECKTFAEKWGSTGDSATYTVGPGKHVVVDFLTTGGNHIFKINGGQMSLGFPTNVTAAMLNGLALPSGTTLQITTISNAGGAMISGYEYDN